VIAEACFKVLNQALPGQKREKPFIEKIYERLLTCPFYRRLNFNLLWLREARKRLALAAASTIAGRTNYIARIATVIASSESTEQSLQAESREVEQMTTGTAIGIAQVAARIAIANNVTRTAIADFIARIATVVVTTTVETFEQVSERSELRRDATVDIAAWIAIGDDIAWIAVADNIARTACL